MEHMKEIKCVFLNSILNVEKNYVKIHFLKIFLSSPGLAKGWVASIIKGDKYFTPKCSISTTQFIVKIEHFEEEDSMPGCVKQLFHDFKTNVLYFHYIYVHAQFPLYLKQKEWYLSVMLWKIVLV